MKMHSNSRSRHQVGLDYLGPSKEWFGLTVRRTCAFDQDQNQLALSANRQRMSDTNTMMGLLDFVPT